MLLETNCEIIEKDRSTKTAFIDLNGALRLQLQNNNTDRSGQLNNLFIYFLQATLGVNLTKYYFVITEYDSDSTSMILLKLQ